MYLSPWYTYLSPRSTHCHRDPCVCHCDPCICHYDPYICHHDPCVCHCDSCIHCCRVFLDRLGGGYLMYRSRNRINWDKQYKWTPSVSVSVHASVPFCPVLVWRCPSSLLSCSCLVLSWFRSVLFLFGLFWFCSVLELSGYGTVLVLFCSVPALDLSIFVLALFWRRSVLFLLWWVLFCHRFDAVLYCSLLCSVLAVRFCSDIALLCSRALLFWLLFCFSRPASFFLR